MYIHPAAEKAIAQLNSQGHEAFLVGGCVRDSLMNKRPHDWDICTSALPEQVAGCFPQAHVVGTGIKHGTLTVVLEGLPLEITTYRVDGAYADHRRPTQVTFVGSLREDLARRDFTINAMAFHPKEGVKDYFGGQADIATKTLRSVGTPEQRFQEDGLRIMRGLRFSSQLGFIPSPELADAMHSCRGLLTHISPERLYAELCGLLMGSGVVEVLLAFPDVLATFLPEVTPMAGMPQHSPYHQYDLWEHTARAVGAIPPQKVLRLAMFFHDMGKPAVHSQGQAGMDRFYGHPEVGATMAQDVLKRLKADNHTLDTVCQLVLYHDVTINPDGVVRWLNRLGSEGLELLLQVKRADILAQREDRRKEALEALDALEARRKELLAAGQAFQLKDLAVNGRDLLAAGVPAGKAVGEALNRLLGLVMDGKVENERDALLGAL